MKKESLTATGIWGYGITGASYIRYCQRTMQTNIHLFDEKALPTETINLLQKQGIATYKPDKRETFLAAVDHIMLSPGIPPQHIPDTAHPKLISELALFSAEWTGTLVGITGTVGKTTITHTLTHLLQRSTHHPVYACGNIGIPMLDILSHNNTAAHAIVELSSFQLMQGLAQPPTLAILTNLYENHLDYHGSMHNYLAAKCNLLRAQTIPWRSLVPLNLLGTINALLPDRPPMVWFSLTPPTAAQHAVCHADDIGYYLDEEHLIRITHGVSTIQGLLQHIPGSYLENALIVQTALDILGYAVAPAAWHTIQLPAHRGAMIRTVADITFYNDSKATIPQATLAAVARHQSTNSDAPVVLFWGGVSKGVDRQHATHQLAQRARLMVCFGHEAEQLATWSTQAGGIALWAATVEEALTRYWSCYAQRRDHVIFSPGGASYDLFKNFEERGAYFSQLVQQLLPHEWHTQVPPER